MNFKKLAITLGVGLALVTGAAQSSVATHSFEDDDLDFLLRPDGTTASLQTAIVTNTPFEIGDILVSAFEFPVYTIDGANAIPAGQELTGVAAIQIVAILNAAGDGPSDGTNFGDQLIFGPAGLDAILAANGVTLGMPLGAGATIAMFFNGTSGAGGDDNLQIGKADGTPTGNPSCTGLSDCLDQATLGTKFQVDGFLGDPDEFWVSRLLNAGGGTPNTVLNLNNNLILASFAAAQSSLFHAGLANTDPNFAVQLTDIGTGLPCGPNAVAADGCANFVISGTITGGQGIPGSTSNPGALHGAFAHSDIDAIKHVVPEPTSVMLMGIGLLAFGARSFRRKA